MPVNDRYPLSDVLAECHRYFALRRRKVFVEYVMLAGVNDSPARAKELATLLDPKVFKVNLIPYNPTGLGNKGMNTKVPREPRLPPSSPCSTARGFPPPFASRAAVTSRPPAANSRLNGSALSVCCAIAWKAAKRANPGTVPR